LADEEGNVVAGYVLGREEGELSSRDARVRLVVGEGEYELDGSQARELVQRLLVGPRYEASERLAPTISRALEGQAGERIVLDDDDVHAVSHVLGSPDPQPDSQLFALQTAVEGVVDAISERDELSLRDARVRLVVGEGEYELDGIEARELVQRLLVGPRYEASERLAPTISRALEGQAGERIVLDDDDVHAVSHVLGWPDPQPDSQLFALQTAVERVADAWRERDADE
jgi:hypothetical protein